MTSSTAFSELAGTGANRSFRPLHASERRAPEDRTTARHRRESGFPRPTGRRRPPRSPTVPNRLGAAAGAVTRSRRESFLELTLQRIGCRPFPSLGLRGLFRRLPGHNVYVAEDVLAVGVFVALTFRDRTLARSLPPNQTHGGIIARPWRRPLGQCSPRAFNVALCRNCDRAGASPAGLQTGGSSQPLKRRFTIKVSRSLAL